MVSSAGWNFAPDITRFSGRNTNAVRARKDVIVFVMGKGAVIALAPKTLSRFENYQNVEMREFTDSHSLAALIQTGELKD